MNIQIIIEAMSVSYMSPVSPKFHIVSLKNFRGEQSYQKFNKKLNKSEKVKFSKKIKDLENFTEPINKILLCKGKKCQSHYCQLRLKSKNVVSHYHCDYLIFFPHLLIYKSCVLKRINLYLFIYIQN